MTADPRWFAAYVRCRHESRIGEHLAARQVEHFLPQYKSERRWTDRKVELLLPLFPGYIFVRISLDQRSRVVETPGVIYLVGASGHPEELEDAEIEQLKEAMSKGNDPRPHAFIKVGERVMVTHGPMQGMEGFVVREKNKSRVVLTLDLINRSMSVEVDADTIAPVNARNTKHAAGDYSSPRG